MELRLLKSFCVVAEEEHFHRAAQRLNLAQPSLTAQIKQLEADLGQKLFERHSRQVSLTNAGRLLWDHAEQVLRQAAAARQALLELDQLQRGQVNAGVVQTVKTCLAPEVVATFLRQFPGIGLDLQELPADDLEALVENGQLDCGLSFGPPRNGNLEWDSLFQEELVAVAPRSHPWAKRRFVRFEEFASESLVLLRHGFCTRRLFDERARIAGLSPKIVYETNSIESILLTLNPLGAVTFLPKLVERLPALADTLKTLPIKTENGDLIRRHVAIVTPKNRSLSKAAQAFLAAWRQAAAQLPQT